MSAIPASTREILARSTFRVDPEPYLWLKAAEVRDHHLHLMIGRDDLETTVVTRAANLGSVEVVDRNPDRWVLLSIDCANPFYCVGFLAAIAEIFVASSLDILVLSAFTRDLVFVKEGDVEAARSALVAVGLEERSTAG